MKAMVLGAGAGTRLEPITQNIPKPLVPILNRPVIEHILRLLVRNQITSVVVNTHHLAGQMKTFFDASPVEEMTAHLVHEPELTGDAGGVRTCRHLLGEGTFLVIMGDLLTDAPIVEMVKQHKKKGALASIGVKRVKDVTKFGVVVRDAEGFITGFQEKPKAEEAISDLISTGIYILEERVFDYIPKSGMYGFGRQLFPDLVQKGLPVLAVDVNSYWQDIGNLNDYMHANFDALEGKVEVEVFGRRSQGMVICGRPRIFEDCKVEGDLLVGDGAGLSAGVSTSGRVIIGNGAEIGRNSRLKDCIIFPNVKVPPESVIENSIFAYGHLVRTDGSQKAVRL